MTQPPRTPPTPEGQTPSEWFGRYELLNPLRRTTNTDRHRARLIGPGGFEKICVIERLSAEASEDPNLVNAFRRAAQRVAVLHHPNLVEIYELGVIDGQYYAATELVDGPSLAELLEESWRTDRPLELAFGLEVLDALCNVLLCIHNAPGPDGRRGSITHGGLTAERVVLTRHGFIKLFDVGQAEGDAGVNDDIDALGGLLWSFLERHEAPPLALRELAMRLDNDEFSTLEDLHDALRSAAFEARLKPWDHVAAVVMASEWMRTRQPSSPVVVGDTSVYRLKGQTGDTLGDLDHHNFEQLVLAQAVSPSDQVSVNGGEWQPAEELAEFGELTRCLIKLPEPSWSADLEIMTLIFGLTQVGLKGHTGALKFQWGQRLKQFYFRDGQVISSTSTLKHELLGPSLVAANVVSPADLSAASRHMELTGMKLGSALIALGTCGQEELHRELTRQLHARLSDLASWGGGTALFIDQEAPAVPPTTFNLDGVRLAHDLVFDSLEMSQIESNTARLHGKALVPLIDIMAPDERLASGEEVRALAHSLTAHQDVETALMSVSAQSTSEQSTLRALLWLVGSGVFKARDETANA